MTKETAKECVDMLFRMWDEDDKDAFINKNTKAIILDFIGGEPMLQTEIIDYVCSYMVLEALKRNCPWKENWMCSISTNGTLHFRKEVQDFLKKFEGHISYGISIDGDKDIHDSCRVYPDGSGSWEDATRAQQDYNKNHQSSSGTKATICQATIPKIDQIVKYFIDQGYTEIHCNPDYEDHYTIEDAKMYYEKAKILARMLLDKKGEIDISIFDENFFKPKREDDLQCWCGGSGKMLAFDYRGVCYPCVRYMESSMGEMGKIFHIGTCKEGIYKTEESKKLLETMKSWDRRTMCEDDLFYHPIASGFSDCMAWNIQEAQCFNKISTNILPLHEARSLINVLYWNSLYILKGEHKYFHRYLPNEIALKYVSWQELDLMDRLENYNKSLSNSIRVNDVEISEDRKHLYKNCRW